MVNLRFHTRPNSGTWLCGNLHNYRGIYKTSDRREYQCMRPDSSVDKRSETSFHSPNDPMLNVRHPIQQRRQRSSYPLPASISVTSSPDFGVLVSWFPGTLLLRASPNKRGRTYLRPNSGTWMPQRNAFSTPLAGRASSRPLVRNFHVSSWTG